MFCCIFNSCEAIKILEATKQKVYSEDNKMSFGYSFSVYIKVHRITIVDAVGLGNECTKTHEYEISHLVSGAVLTSQEVLKKDDYLIQFYLDGNNLPNDTDQVCLYYQKESKQRIITANVLVQQDLFVKQKKTKGILIN